MLMYFYFQFIRIYIIQYLYIFFTTPLSDGSSMVLESSNKIFKNNIKKNSQLQAVDGV